MIQKQLTRTDVVPMRVRGLWSPVPSFWQRLLSGSDAWEALRTEEKNESLPVGQRIHLGDDRSGAWPDHVPDEDEAITAVEASRRVIQAASSYDKIVQAALQDQAAVSSVQEQFWSPLRTVRDGMADVTMQGALLRANTVAAFIQDAGELEALMHLLMRDEQTSGSFPKTAAMAVWLPAAVALVYKRQDPDKEVELFRRAIKATAEVSERKLSADEIDQVIAQRMPVIRFVQALLAQPGATSHALKRWIAQQLWGGCGWLGSYPKTGDAFWRGCLFTALTLHVDDEFSVPLETGAEVLGWCGGDVQIYAAARTIQQRAAFISLIQDPKVLMQPSKEPNVSFTDHQEMTLCKLRDRLEELERQVEGDSQKDMSRMLAPLVTEEMLLAVSARVLRHRRALLRGSLPNQLISGLTWEFLHALQDDRANWGQPRITNMSYIGDSAAPGTRAEWEEEVWPGFADDVELSEVMRDWRVAEVLMPMLAATIGRMLRSHGRLKGDQTVWDAELGSLFPDPLPLDLEVRSFLTACGRIMADKDAGGLTAETVSARLPDSVDEDVLLDWLACQPFTLQQIEQQMLQCGDSTEDLAMLLAGSLVESRAFGGHALPDWANSELDLIEDHCRAFRKERDLLVPTGLLDVLDAEAEPDPEPELKTKGHGKGKEGFANG